MNHLKNIASEVLAIPKIDGKMMIADPMNRPDTWCVLELDVKPGRWKISVNTADTPDGLKPISLEAQHVDFRRPLVFEDGKRKLIVDIDYVYTEEPMFEQYGARIVGVDSAHLGIFDAKQFAEGDSKERLNESFERTEGGKYGGVVAGGGVAKTADGDGVYWPSVSRNEDGEIDFVIIPFVEESDFDEEESNGKDEV